MYEWQKGRAEKYFIWSAVLLQVVMRFLRVYIYSKSLINVFETVQQSTKDKEDICRSGAFFTVVR